MINVFVLQNGRLSQIPIESRDDLVNVTPVWVDLTEAFDRFLDAGNFSVYAGGHDWPPFVDR